VLQVIIEVFNINSKVSENGLIAFSGLCNGLGQRLNLKAFNFNSFLLWGLNNPSDKDVVRLSCMCISDISLALKGAVNEYMVDFFNNIKNIIINP
jgi:hypothetical protein